MERFGCPGNPFYKTHFWEKLRLAALRRDNWVCQRCGVKALGKKRNGISPHVDHIKERGGATGPTALDTLENLQVLCSKCHNVRTAIDREAKAKPLIGYDGLPVDGWD